MVVCACVIPGLGRKRHAEIPTAWWPASLAYIVSSRVNRGLVTHCGWHLTSRPVVVLMHTHPELG